MSEASALHRLLAQAPPRSAEVVKRVTLDGLDLAALAGLFGVDEERARVLVFRAFLDVHSGGAAAVPDAEEARELRAFFAGEAGPVATPLLTLRAQLEANRDALRARLEAAAKEWEASPAREREEWLRRLAIVLVLALSAFFYWREQHKPRPPPERRPTVVPQGKG